MRASISRHLFCTPRIKTFCRWYQQWTPCQWSPTVSWHLAKSCVLYRWLRRRNVMQLYLYNCITFLLLFVSSLKIDLYLCCHDLIYSPRVYHQNLSHEILFDCNILLFVVYIIFIVTSFNTLLYFQNIYRFPISIHPLTYLVIQFHSCFKEFQ